MANATTVCSPESESSALTDEELSGCVGVSWIIGDTGDRRDINLNLSIAHGTDMYGACPCHDTTIEQTGSIQ